MQKKTCRNHSADFKIKILRRHLIDKVPVSTVCGEFDIKPSLFYSWQKDLFDRGSVVFNSVKLNSVHSDYQKQIDRLNHKLNQKNEVLAELMQEHISLKKEHGEI